MTKLKSSTQVMLAVLAAFVVLITAAIGLGTEFSRKNNVSADSNNINFSMAYGSGGASAYLIRGDEVIYVYFDITKSDGTTTRVVKTMVNNGDVIGIDNATKIHIRVVSPPTLRTDISLNNEKQFNSFEVTLNNVSSFLIGNTIDLHIILTGLDNTWFDGSKLF